MKNLTTKALVIAIAAGSAHMAQAADTIQEALKESTVSGNFNMRHENVDFTAAESEQTNLRTRITVTTGNYQGWNAVLGFEDVSDVFGDEDESDIAGPSRIPEAEVTEIDQAFFQYKSDDMTVKVGRQVIALDNQRYIGHVGWRQDRQTYDGISLSNKFGGFSYDLAYINNVQGINGENTADSQSFILHGSVDTGIGKITPYAYLLELNDVAIDTLGARLTGSVGPVGYTAEVATQDADGGDTTYFLVEGSTKLADVVTAKLGYEKRGSDEGTYGFTVPLGTNHAHNGWADVYLNGPALANGLTDLYVSFGAKAGPVNLLAVYHDFESDFGSTDMGSEIDLQATMPLGAGFTGGLKYAAFSEGDNGIADREKLWAWVTYAF